MNRLDETLLRDMLDAALALHQFVADENRMMQRAIERTIEIIGEAASKVSSETRIATPHIAWQNIIGMRHRLIHGHASVDEDIVWVTATQHIPNRIIDLISLLGSKNASTDSPAG